MTGSEACGNDVMPGIFTPPVGKHWDEWSSTWIK